MFRYNNLIGQALNIVEHRLLVGTANCCGLNLPGANQLLCPAEGFGS